MFDKNLIELPAWQNENIWLIRSIGLGWALFFAFATISLLDFKILFLIAYIFFLVVAIYFPKFLVKTKIINLSFNLKNFFLKINNIIFAFLMYAGIIGVIAIFFKFQLKKTQRFVRNFKNKLPIKIADKINVSFFKEQNKYSDLVSKYC